MNETHFSPAVPACLLFGALYKLCQSYVRILTFSGVSLCVLLLLFLDVIARIGREGVLENAISATKVSAGERMFRTTKPADNELHVGSPYRGRIPIVLSSSVAPDDAGLDTEKAAA